MCNVAMKISTKQKSNQNQGSQCLSGYIQATFQFPMTKGCANISTPRVCKVWSAGTIYLLSTVPRPAQAAPAERLSRQRGAREWRCTGRPRKPRKPRKQRKPRRPRYPRPDPCLQLSRLHKGAGQPHNFQMKRLLLRVLLMKTCMMCIIKAM